jgi:pilus assembly protein Flp/PilA
MRILDSRARYRSSFVQTANLLMRERGFQMYLLKKMRQFLVSEDGPTAVEYAVMLALIIVVCLIAIQSLGTNTSTTFTNISNSLGS